MEWDIRFDEEFLIEFREFSEEVQDGLLEKLEPLRKYGPNTDRPLVDTLNASTHSNMKELRFNADGGVWRAAFAFDPKRQAIILAAADKKGADQKKFYKNLIKKADKRFAKHLDKIK